MERPRPSTVAWATLAGGVALYDCVCPKGETLSEAADRGLERPIGKFLVSGAIATVALHLANVIPQKYDPIHYALAWKNTEENHG